MLEWKNISCRVRQTNDNKTKTHTNTYTRTHSLTTNQFSYKRKKKIENRNEKKKGFDQYCTHVRTHSLTQPDPNVLEPIGTIRRLSFNYIWFCTGQKHSSQKFIQSRCGWYVRSIPLLGKLPDKAVKIKIDQQECKGKGSLILLISTSPSHYSAIPHKRKQLNFLKVLCVHKLHKANFRQTSISFWGLRKVWAQSKKMPIFYRTRTKKNLFSLNKILLFPRFISVQWSLMAWKSNVSGHAQVYVLITLAQSVQHSKTIIKTNLISIAHPSEET